MAISELLEVVAPPDRPLYAEGRDHFLSLERYLGASLPPDYIELGQRYGNGSFGDSTFYFWINNPFSPTSVQTVAEEIDHWRLCRAHFPEEYAHDIFPARPGYLPSGHDVDGGKMGWIVDGPPEAWPVVAKSRDLTYFEVFEMSITTFLAKALKHELRPEMWRSDFPRDVRKVKFASNESG